MGRLVYISAPNFMDVELLGTNVRGGEFFHNMTRTIRDNLKINGIDACIASSAIRERGERYTDSENIHSEFYIDIVMGEEFSVGVDIGFGDEYRMGRSLSKKLSKIDKKNKYRLVDRTLAIDVPYIEVSLKDDSVDNSTYLLTQSERIGIEIAKAVCAYFGVIWNYRPREVNENEFSVYIPPFTNIIKARTISSTLKKDNNVISKVI